MYICNMYNTYHTHNISNKLHVDLVLDLSESLTVFHHCHLDSRFMTSPVGPAKSESPVA